jgi:hypothetical protein
VACDPAGGPRRRAPRAGSGIGLAIEQGMQVCRVFGAVTWVVSCLLAPGARAELFVDDFEDGISSYAWTVEPGASGSVEVIDGELVLTQGSDPFVRLEFNYPIDGDFDARVDYRLIDWPANNQERIGLILMAPDESVGIAAVERFSDNEFVGGNEGYLTHLLQATLNRITSIGTTDAAGTLRLTRVGNTVAGYFWNGSAWVLLDAASDASANPGPSPLWLAIWWQGVPSPVRVAFDNFSLAAPAMQIADPDGDGVPNLADNCPGAANPTQTNFDGDGRGDACDACETIADAASDQDVDGVDDACDTCTNLGNPQLAGAPAANRSFVSHQRDDDADGRGNRCDFNYDQLGAVITAEDFNAMKANVGRLVTATTCSSGPYCGEFDHDSVGSVITASDFNLTKAAVGKIEATDFPTCAACAVGTGWSNALGSGGERIGRPVCQSAVAGQCAYAP